MTNIFDRLLNWRNGNDTPDYKMITRFRKETIRRLRSADYDCAGDLQDNIKVVDAIAAAKNLKLMFVVNRNLSRHHSVRELVRITSDLRNRGWNNHYDRVTPESLAARRRVRAAMEAAGAFPWCSDQTGLLVLARPEQESNILRFINEEGLTDSRRIHNRLDETVGA